MKIHKEEILKIIDKVMPGVEKKGLVEEMGQIVFDGNFVLTYNDKVAICYPVTSEAFNLSCGVVATDFVRAVKGIKTKDIEIEKEEGGLLISGGKNRTVLPFYDEKKITELHNSLNISEVDGKFIKLPKNFLDGLRTCKFSASDNLDNPKGLYCLKIEGNTIFSTNGYQATIYYTEDVGFGKVFISKMFIDSILSFNPTDAVFTKSWAFFLNEDDAILACRMATITSFPKGIESAFPEFEKGFKFKETMDDELSSLEFFAEGSDKSDKNTEVVINENGTVIMESTSAKGSVTIETEVDDYDGKEIKFLINPNYLKECMDLKGEMHVTEKMLSIKTSTFQHLVALKVLQ